MSETTPDRAELARDIACHLDTIFGNRDFGPAQQDYRLADALLAVGWGKIQKASEVEQLASAIYAAGGDNCGCATGPEGIAEELVAAGYHK